jgi:Retinal pigment epithelial membrane protein
MPAYVKNGLPVGTAAGNPVHRDLPGGPGEPIFVATPGTPGEDDGVVLSVVLDSATDTSFLLALDAQSWFELAKAHVPRFHGRLTRDRASSGAST